MECKNAKTDGGADVDPEYEAAFDQAVSDYKSYCEDIVPKEPTPFAEWLKNWPYREKKA